MGCTLIRSPPFEGGDGRLASVPTDNGTNAFALDGQGERALSSYRCVWGRDSDTGSRFSRPYRNPLKDFPNSERI